MAGGQQIDVGQGTLLPDSDRVQAVGGEVVTLSPGALGDARVIPLRSRKTGTGAAVWQLSGIASAVQQGLLTQATRLTGHAANLAQQSMGLGARWLSTPSVSFAEAGTTGVNLGQWVVAYNAGTDEFRWTPGYTPPPWLQLTTANLSVLTPDGSQDPGDTFDNTPGIAIDVRRSGGAWVSSAAFGVTVYVAGSGVATWSELMPLIYNANTSEGNKGVFGQYLKSDLVDNYAEWQGVEVIASDTTNWSMVGTGVYGSYFPIAVDELNGWHIIIPG